MTRTRRIALWCSAIAVAVCGVAVAASLSVRDWRLSALVRMSDSEPMAAEARATDPVFAFVNVQAHYDGVYFYAIARDPFARGDAHTRIDRPAYRYGHAGYGWLAWLASAGRPRTIPAALLALSLAGVALAAFAGSLLAAEMGWSPWGGLVVAFTPGIVLAATVDTSEPLALAATLLALLAWMRGRRGWGAAALVIACFLKEPLLLVAVGLSVWEFAVWVRTRAPGFVRRVLPLSIGPILYGGWYVYLRSTFGVWPFKQEAGDYLTVPVVAWWDSFQRAARLATGPFDQMQIGYTSVALLAVAGGLLLLGIVRGVRVLSPVDPVFVLIALLVFSLNWYGVLYPKDLLRESAVAMALLPAVLVGSRRAGRAAESGPLSPGESG